MKHQRPTGKTFVAQMQQDMKHIPTPVKAARLPNDIMGFLAPLRCRKDVKILDLKLGNELTQEQMEQVAAVVTKSNGSVRASTSFKFNGIALITNDVLANDYDIEDDEDDPWYEYTLISDTGILVQFTLLTESWGDHEDYQKVKRKIWQAAEEAPVAPPKVQVRDTLAGEVLAHIRIINNNPQSNIIDDAAHYGPIIKSSIELLTACDEDPLLAIERHVAIIALMVMKSKKNDERNVLWFANEVDENIRLALMAL